MRRCLLAGWLVIAACSHDEVVDKAKCTQMRDHMIDLRLAGAAGSDEMDLAQHRTAMKQALGESFLADCQHNMTIEQLHCAMKATDLQASIACSNSTAH